MNNFSKFLAGVVAGIVIVAMSQINAADNNRLELVQSGELELTCHLPKGVTVIEPTMVIDYHSEVGWKFKNGSAKSCWTK